MKPNHSLMLVLVMLLGTSMGLSDWSKFVVAFCKRFKVNDLQILTLKPKNKTYIHDEADDILELVQEILDVVNIRVQTVSSLTQDNDLHLNNRFNPNARSTLFAPSKETLTSFKTELDNSQPFGAGNRWLIVIPQENYEQLTTVTMGKSTAFSDSNVTVATIQSNGDAKLEEVYRIDTKSSLRRDDVGVWNQRAQRVSQQFVMQPMPMLWVRRKHLEGHTLKVMVDTIRKCAPFFSQKENILVANPSGNRLEIGERGYYEEIFHSLRKNLNFKYSLGISELDKIYGQLAVDGRTWVGMIKGLVNGSYDMIVGPFSITSVRQTAIDFTTPLLIDGIYIYLQWSEPGSSGSSWWRAAVMPFHWNMWTSLGISIIVVSLVLYFTTRMTCRQLDPLLKDQFWIVFSAVCQKGVQSEDHPPCVSGRLVVWFGSFLFLFSYWCYGALFTSYLTVRELTLPFQNVEQILHRNDWKLCAHPWMLSTLFTKNDPMEVYREMNKKILTDECTYEDLNGGAELATIENHAALANQLTVNNVFNIHLDWACLVSHIPGSYFTDNQAMGLQHSSPYLRLMNYHLLKMHTTGVLDALKSRWNKLRSFSCGGVNQPVEAFSAVKVLAPCVILATGMILSIVLFTLEKIMEWRKEGEKQIEESAETEVEVYIPPPKHMFLP